MSSNYEVETKKAYQNPEKAKIYREQHQDTLSWARFTMWREISDVKKALDYFNVTVDDIVIDLPCGTGVAGAALSKSSAKLIAMDISRDMMLLAREEYRDNDFEGFVQTDITQIPFPDCFVTGAVCLGFMHRVPEEIKFKALCEIYRTSKKFAIVSFTYDSPAQRFKKKIVSTIKPGHEYAPASMTIDAIKTMIDKAGFTIINTMYVAPGLSGEVMFWLKK